MAVVQPPLAPPSPRRTLALARERTADGQRAVLRLGGLAAGAPLAAFALLWNGSLVLWYVLTLSGGLHVLGGTLILVPVFHVIAGMRLVREALAAFLNRATFELTADTFTTTVGPIARTEHADNAYDIDAFTVCPLGTADDYGESAARRRVVATVQVVYRDGTRIDLPLPALAVDEARDVAGELQSWIDERRAFRGYRS